MRLMSTEKKRSDYWRNWIFVLEVMLLISICILYSISTNKYANFYPINGTFQNYNPVRRFLDGQIPYRDFQDYLGLGHLYTGVFATFLLGKSYQDSLVAFEFLTLLSFVLLSILTGYAIVRKKELVGAFTTLVLLLMGISTFADSVTGGNEVLGALQTVRTVGNSARFIRGMVLPIVCLLLILGYKIKTIIDRKAVISCKENRIIAYLGIGVIAGFAFCWSNDYGISSWICLIIMFFWVVFSRTRNLLQAAMSALITCLASGVSAAVIVQILTWGHLRNWCISTFGTGGYQSWYYNGGKSFYLYNIDFSFPMCLQAGITIYCLIRVFRERGNYNSLMHYGIVGFCNMTCYCSVNAYKLMSGGSSKEVAFTVLFFTICYEAIYGITRKTGETKFGRGFVAASLLIGFGWSIHQYGENRIFQYSGQTGSYIDQMGGVVTYLTSDLLQTGDFLGTESFFSTYSSGQEVISDIYQPSGTDYIIHVLGDAERKQYLDAYRNQQYKYVATIRNAYVPWEYWCERANWFFYRELYKDWHPVYGNEYELYWEKNKEPCEYSYPGTYEARIVDVDETTKKIVVECDSDVSGIADVYIDYSIYRKAGLRAKLLFQSMLLVKNTGELDSTNDRWYESNYLRSESAEFIPIRVINGYGEVTLTSKPEQSTGLVLNDCQCEALYTVIYDYVKMETMDVSGDQTVFYISDSVRNERILENVKTIRYGSLYYNVREMTTKDEYIGLCVDARCEECDENILEIIND